MKKMIGSLLGVMLACGCSQLAPAQPQTLAGTSWQLVRFQGGDGTVRTPDDKSKYTLEFGAMAMTRAACPPGSLHDQLVKHWPYVRSYLLKGGHLYLSLMADGGIYEFEPAR
jgi:para-nitrobenzyl esterase